MWRFGCVNEKVSCSSLFDAGGENDFGKRYPPVAFQVNWVRQEVTKRCHFFATVYIHGTC